MQNPRPIPLAACLCLLLAPAGASAATVHLRAVVDESHVVRPPAFQPPVFGTGSPGSGIADLRVDTETAEFRFEVEISGIDPSIIDNTLGANGTGLHLHSGESETRGPFILDVHHYARQARPETNGLIRTEAGFRLEAEGTIEQVQGALDVGVSTERILDFIRSERVFLGVHTTTNDLFRSGAIRGNFKIVPPRLRLTTRLDESQVVRPPAFQPPQFGTGSPGEGTAVLDVDTVAGTFVLDMEIDGISPSIIDNTLGANRTGIHVHSGTPDVRGPFIIDVHHFAREALPETNGLEATATGFRLRAEGAIDQVQGALDTGFTRDEIIDALRAGEAFIAVHTTTNELFRTGAIRGNFEVEEERLRLRADVDESFVVRPPAFQPPVFGTGSPGVGVAELTVDPVTADFVFDMEIDGISPVIIDNTLGPNATGIHVHRGTPDVRGPFTIDVHHFARLARPETNGLEATETGFRLHAEGKVSRFQGELDTGFEIDEVLGFLTSGESFVAAHTTTNELFRTGAIRGNFVEVTGDRFVRGDCNSDGSGDIADAVCTLNWLFLGAAAPTCLAAADANDSGDVNVADPSYLLNFLFSGGPPPPAPHPACGPGAADSLGCDVPSCPE